MNRLADAFMESTVLQATLALMFGGTICYMYLIGMDVPESLAGFLGAIIGFYFRSKAGAEVRKTLEL